MGGTVVYAGPMHQNQSQIKVSKDPPFIAWEYVGRSYQLVLTDFSRFQENS